MSHKVLIPLAVAGAGYAVYKYLFKVPGHASLWGPTQAREYFEANGQHHPDTPKHIREQVDNPKGFDPASLVSSIFAKHS